VSNQPRTIQLYFDGVEVLRIEDGVKCYEVLAPANTEPNKIEMAWDGTIVYSVSPASNQVPVNLLF
jgi:hypothetical protein